MPTPNETSNPTQPDRPGRVLGTIDVTDERLTGLVYRYRAHDGLDGEEGVFLL